MNCFHVLLITHAQNSRTKDIVNYINGNNTVMMTAAIMRHRENGSMQHLVSEIWSKGGKEREEGRSHHLCFDPSAGQASFPADP